MTLHTHAAPALPRPFSDLSGLRADAPLHALAALHVAFAAALWLVLGAPGEGAFFSYVTVWVVPALWLAVVYVAAAAGTGVIRRRPARPLAELAACAGEALARIAPGLALYAALALSMGAFTTIKTLLPELQPYAWDPALAALDRALHGGRDPWDLLQPLLGRPAVTRAIETLYHPVWVAVLAVTPLLVAVFCRERQLRAQYLLAFMLCWILLGGLAAGLLLSGGPAYYERFTGDGERYAAMAAYLRQSPGVGVTAIHDFLWRGYQEGRSGLGLGISAFPSLHVAMATLWVLLGRRLHPALGLAAAAYAVAICLGSVHLGWHYALEIYFGVPAVLALWWLCGRLARR